MRFMVWCSRLQGRSHDGAGRGLPIPAKMLDLCAWFYTTLHLLVFAQVYIGWSGEILLEELAERPYVLVGFLAWLILVPLGITSANSIRRKIINSTAGYTSSLMWWLFLDGRHLLWLVSISMLAMLWSMDAVFAFLFALRIPETRWLTCLKRRLRIALPLDRHHFQTLANPAIKGVGVSETLSLLLQCANALKKNPLLPRICNKGMKV